jgi:L-2-hydroxyglutarate oxidase LhgO
MAQRVCVIGAGIIGLAVARRVSQIRPEASITVVEKERRVASHQTGRNSGVAHAGIYYAPGSLKARLCQRDVETLTQYCGERGLPYEECGKTVVAIDESERERLRGLGTAGSMALSRLICPGGSCHEPAEYVGRL